MSSETINFDYMKTMRLTVFLLLFCCLAGEINAQTSGTILFEEKLVLNFEGREGMSDRWKEMMEKYKNQTFNKQLLFSEAESMYMSQPEKEEEMAPGQGRGRWMRMMNPEERIYTSLTGKGTVEERVFMDKKFLIKDKAEERKWKLANGETKMVMGVLCMKATVEEENREGEMKTTTAWFAPSMAISSGPDGYSGLPGMILELSRRDGDHLITATEIKEELNKEDIAEPKKGKKVTREQFETIVKTKMEEMRAERKANGGGSGGHGFH